ncbi:tetratricopeptide repeat protein 12-like [Argopecten irradians]|uniref:tetratricopeptide repeat protein 12-like n=1 Tax=Argopecten irradians TaxID=31199 RepID=UPI00371518E4
MASKGKADPQLDDFLSKVDQIESIVKTLKYGDDTQVKTAMQEADTMLAHAKTQKGHFPEDLGPMEPGDEDLPKTKTGFSKTMINTAPTSNTERPGADNPQFDNTSQESFMAAMEADANERAERRKKRQKEANVIKEKGNEEFRQGKFEKALEYYSEALQKVKDNTVLYTNRAQTLIKLQRYEEALTDCDWALRVFPNCIKAHIHMGRAHMGLGQYEKARECLHKAQECDPKRENAIKEYLSEVDRLEQKDSQEAQAKQLFDSGDEAAQTVVQLLEKVCKPDQLPLYYSGGFNLICSRLQTMEDKTLFRTNGGINMFSSHPCFSKCIGSQPRSLSQEQLTMLTGGIEMFAMACTENESNQQQLLGVNSFSEHILQFLEVKIKGQGRLMKSACVTLLHRLTLSESGRSMVIRVFNLTRLITVLFELIRTNVTIAITAGSVLNNLALDKMFKSKLRDKIDVDVLPAFESLLKDGCSGQACVLPTCVTTMMNLATDTIIRDKLCARQDLWKAVMDLMAQHKERLEQPISVELVESLLGLLSNLTFTISPQHKEHAVSICKQCLEFCKKFKHYKLIVSRSLGVLSHVLPKSIPSVDWLCTENGAEVLMYHVKSEDDAENRKHALKGLTACTQINELARIFIVDHKGLGTLMRLLKADDEILIGNSALSLGHCTQVPKVCAALAKTDVIKDLLVLARDGKRPAVQQNCAILIAKLAQGDSRHLERLRELHGVDILHNCMKHLK